MTEPLRECGALRRHLLERVDREYLACAARTGRAALDSRVRDAMLEIPRHVFVPDRDVEAAYANTPLAIGYGQTISQPFIVALMTDLLETRPEHTVLEIGTGSGYQAAVLSRLVRHVYSVEVVAPLAERAAARLARLGLANITVRTGDGAEGWPEHAPYDGILVTAATPRVPAPLLDQLARGGRLAVPIDVVGGHADLTLLHKGTDGTVRRRSVLPVSFVPLVRP